MRTQISKKKGVREIKKIGRKQNASCKKVLIALDSFKQQGAK